AQKLFDVIEAILPTSPPPPGTPRAETAAGAVVDKTVILEQVKGDEELLSELVQVFQGDCPRMMQQLRETLAEKGGEKLGGAADSLMGAVGNCGPSPALELARQLEAAAQAGDLGEAEQLFRDLEIALPRLQTALTSWVPQSASYRGQPF